MNRRLLGFAAAALLTVSTATFAAPQQKASAPAKAAAPKTAPTHTTRGTITSVNATQLMISPGKGKKDLAFVLGADSQRPTSLSAGDKVTVHYRVENNQNMATSIQSQAVKNAGNTAKKKS